MPTTLTLDLSDPPEILRAAGQMLLSLSSYTGGKSTGFWDDPAEAETPDELLSRYETRSVTKETEDEPAPAPAHTLGLDSAGFPWDPRIHSSNQKTVGDGTWRQKRGIDPAVKAAVEAELKPAGAAPPPPPPSAVMPPPPPPSAVLPPPPPSALTLVEATNRIVAAMGEKRLSTMDIVNACNALGVEGGLYAMAARPDLLPALMTSLGLEP